MPEESLERGPTSAGRADKRLHGDGPTEECRMRQAYGAEPARPRTRDTWHSWSRWSWTSGIAFLHMHR